MLKCTKNMLFCLSVEMISVLLFVNFSHALDKSQKEISPPFNLYWGENIKSFKYKLPKEASLATDEEDSFIRSHIKFSYDGSTNYVIKNFDAFNAIYDVYILTNTATKNLTSICYFKTNGNIDSFYDVVKSLTEKYGEPVQKIGDGVCRNGILKYKKFTWNRARSIASVSYSTCSGNSEIFVLFFGVM